MCLDRDLNPGWHMSSHLCRVKPLSQCQEQRSLLADEAELIVAVLAHMTQEGLWSTLYLLMQ